MARARSRSPSPWIDERDEELVLEVLRSGRLSLGPAGPRFEALLADAVGAPYCAAVSSGTAGLHLCMHLAGVGPGDEVITSPYSFVASANCAIYEGADAGVRRHRLRRRSTSIRRPSRRRSRRGRRRSSRSTSSATRASSTSCARSATGTGSRSSRTRARRSARVYKGRPIGSHGHLATWAFYPNKQITTGEGGAVTTGSAEEHELLVSLRNQGRLETSSWLQHGRLGFNYRLDDISAALGIGQLERLDRILEARREVAERYGELLAGVDVELPLADDADHVRSWFVYVVKLPAGVDRDGVHGQARRRGDRLRAVPAVDPPPVVHARALRLLGGALPGQRGRERRGRWRSRSTRGSRARIRSASPTRSGRARSRLTDGGTSVPRPAARDPRPGVGTHPSALETNSTPARWTCLCRFLGSAVIARRPLGAIIRRMADGAPG